MFVEDLNNLIIRILKSNIKESTIFNVGYGKPINVKSLINMIVKKVKGGKPLFGKIKMRKYEILNLYPNIAKVRKVFNCKQKFTIEKGLNRTIKFYETS